MAKKYAVTKQNPTWMYSSSGYKTQVYQHIKAAGAAGLDRQQLATLVKLNAGRISSYLAELKREGLVHRLGDAIDLAVMNAEEATVYALVALENAVMAKYKELKTVPPEVDRSFLRYNKIKALALGAKTHGEEWSALRLSIIELVKLVF